MQEEPEIAAEVLLPLKLQGIVEVTETALVVRFKFTARPVKPSWVQREYLKRIYRVFAEKGITFASGRPDVENRARLQRRRAMARCWRRAGWQEPGSGHRGDRPGPLSAARRPGSSWIAGMTVAI